MFFVTDLSPHFGHRQRGLRFAGLHVTPERECSLQSSPASEPLQRSCSIHGSDFPTNLKMPDNCAAWCDFVDLNRAR